MSTTDQLPEPDLGYIKTDVSNQPAFSARQMREAMKHALQARAILALRTERAPMTDEQREYFLDGYESAQRDAIACRIPPTGFTFVAVRIDDEALVKRGMDRLREAHHDITAQAKKGTP